MLDIEKIREKHGPRTFTIPVPEWGGDVTIKRFTAQEYITLGSRNFDGNDKQKNFDYMIEVVQDALINEDGTQLIGEEDKYLLVDNPLLVTRLGQEILRLNGLSGEDAGKNSESSPS